jgi:lysophospholipase L1-like esterase
MAFATPKTSRVTWAARFQTLMGKRNTRPIRIMMTGDSITEGYGADDIYKTWPALLQVELESLFPTTGVTSGQYTVSSSATDLPRVKTITRGGFQYIPAIYAFLKPEPWGQTLDKNGVASHSTQAGLGRRATSQAEATSRTWTGAATAVDFIIEHTRAGHAYTISRDGVVVKKVTASTGLGRQVVRVTGGLLTRDSVYTITFDNNTLPLLQGIAVYRGTESKGIQVWESAKSNTEMAQFIYSPTYNNVAQSYWITDLVADLPDVINIAWITNDSSSFKRSAIQYKASVKLFIESFLKEGRKIDPTWNPLISIVSPQERQEARLLTHPDGWAAFVEVQHEIANELENVFVESMSSPGPDGKPHIAKQGTGVKMSGDGIHPSSLGYVDYARNTLDAWIGVFNEDGVPDEDEDDTTTPPVTTPPVTNPPVTSLNFAHVGDSLAEAYTLSNAKLKSAYSTSSFVNQAKGGFLSAQIAAYQGGVPANITIPSGVLPASGPVAVTLDVNLLAIPGATGTWSTTGTFLNVPVKLSMTKTANPTTYKHTLERTSVGSAVNAPDPVPFITGLQYRDRLMLIQIARNDFHVSTPEQVIARINAMFDYNFRDRDDHIIFEIPLADKTIEAEGTTYRIKLDAMNAAIKAAFPKNFVASAAYLRSEAILRNAGLTPTTTDIANIANRTTPESFRVDTLHYNTPAYGQISDLVIKTLTAKGFTPVNAPAPTPDPTPTPDPGTGEPTTPTPTDTTPPTITILSPAPGNVSGTVQFRAKVTDASGVSVVAIYTGPATLIGTARPIAGQTDVWGLDVDAANMQGYSGFRFVAKDSKGNSIPSATVAMTVATVTAPSTAIPEFSNLSPAAGSVVDGPVTFKGTVTIADNLAITDVDLYYGAELLGSLEQVSGTDTWNITINSGELPTGINRYALISRGSNGKTATSSEVPISVKKPEATDPGSTILITSPAQGSVLKDTVTFRAAITSPQSITAKVRILDASNGDLLLDASEYGAGIWGGDILASNLPGTLTGIQYEVTNAKGTKTLSGITRVSILDETFQGDYFASIDKNTYLPPRKTVNALKDAILGDTTVNYGLPKLVIMGDSLGWTWGVNGNDTELKSALGVTRYANTAVSGQNAAQIAARQGGTPAKADFPANRIQKSGTVQLRSVVPNMFAFNGGAGTVTQAVEIAGVAGTIAAIKASDGSYTFQFTRSVAGAEVAVPAPAEIRTGFEYRDSIMVLGLGRNDNISNASSPETLVEPDTIVGYIQSMLDWNLRDPSEHFIRTIPMKASEATDPVANARLRAINDALHEAFPTAIFDDAAFLRSELTLRQKGLTPTGEDMTDISRGFTPVQFRQPGDTLHFNKKAYEMINHYLLRHLKTRGYVNWNEPTY